MSDFFGSIENLNKLASYMKETGHVPDSVEYVDENKYKYTCKDCHMTGELVNSFQNEPLFGGDALMNKCYHMPMRAICIREARRQAVLLEEIAKKLEEK